MKTIILLSSVFISALSFGQSVTSSVNSGALENSSMIFSVGEIFVMPVGNANEANSGTIGVVSRIEFLATGIDEAISTAEFKVYPNPASTSVFFEALGNAPVSTVYVYDISGKLALTQSDVKKCVDLSSLSAGTYLIKTDISNQSFKIVKQ
ncbi:MAG: hypothetical protein JWO03_1622 [Bacteroidetes bacterium]|nr:hypothetical protein [Bacteroidota bacterium]